MPAKFLLVIDSETARPCLLRVRLRKSGVSHTGSNPLVRPIEINWSFLGHHATSDAHEKEHQI